jgi:cytochrome c biogenesis protein CcmG/thiol:disulfide interchange protein DsbE
MKRFWLWAPLGVTALLFGVFGYSLMHPASRDIPSQWVGHPMPPFNLPAAATNRPGFAFANLAYGKPKLVNIFASWCVPCAAEAPLLTTIAQQGVEVDGIALRDRPQDLDAFLARNGNPYTRIGGDVTSSVAIALGSTGVPETYVIDGKGIILKQHIGELHDDDVAELVQMVRGAR